jgi:uncharacterized protein (TIGR02217 family)
VSFIESPRFPDKLAFGASGGPQFRTSVVELASGFEQRNADWSIERRRYDLIHAAKTRDDFDELLAYYLTVARGRLRAFRFRDPMDHNDRHGDAIGWLGSGAGTGAPTHQMQKIYLAGSNAALRVISKPYGTISVTRGGSPVAYGSSAGQISIDTTTGEITFVADDSEAITGHTVGSSHAFTTTANVTQLGIGDKVYIGGVTGTAATLLNSTAHTISNKTGSGPYTWTLDTNTGGSPTLTASGGTIYAYPQADESLIWTGEFDVPVRFDTDELMAMVRGPRLFDLERIPLVEIRV